MRASNGRFLRRPGIHWGGRKRRTPSEGTPAQLDRQFKAFEFSLRSFSHTEIAKLLICRPETVSDDIAFEYERRKAIYGSGRDEFVKRAFHALESVKQMNFEALMVSGGLSRTGHEHRAIMAAIALQARLMGYDAPHRPCARVQGPFDVKLLGLPEMPQQPPEDFVTTLLQAIADSAGRGDDPRLDTPGRDTGPFATGPPDAPPHDNLRTAVDAQF